jgi:hypothetical protein
MTRAARDIGAALAAAAVVLGAAWGGSAYDRESAPRSRSLPADSAPSDRAAPVVAASPPPTPHTVAPAAPSASPPAASIARPSTVALPPAAFAPPHARTAKPGDGTWRPLHASAGKPVDTTAPLAFTTTVHPDPYKAFVEVAIVALDTSRLDLELVPGTEEPENAAIGKDRRPGVVAPVHLPGLIIATNGGYKARHGKHGAQVGGDVFVPPNPESCTIARTADDRIVIGSWPRVETQAAGAKWVRQGPACLLEGGVLHEALASEYGRKKWGAAEDGKKDIRRSAWALGPGGALYFAIGEWTTADLLASALKTAGVTEAVQMDINWSFTRFVLYGRDDAGAPVASSPILEKLKFGPREYWQKPSERDFFYLWKAR